MRVRLAAAFRRLARKLDPGYSPRVVIAPMRKEDALAWVRRASRRMDDGGAL